MWGLSIAGSVTRASLPLRVDMCRVVAVRDDGDAPGAIEPHRPGPRPGFVRDEGDSVSIGRPGQARRGEVPERQPATTTTVGGDDLRRDRREAPVLRRRRRPRFRWESRRRSDPLRATTPRRPHRRRVSEAGSRPSRQSRETGGSGGVTRRYIRTSARMTYSLQEATALGPLLQNATLAPVCDHWHHRLPRPRLGSVRLASTIGTNRVELGVLDRRASFAPRRRSVQSLVVEQRLHLQPTRPTKRA
jgi:hypothetical protein